MAENAGDLFERARRAAAAGRLSHADDYVRSAIAIARDGGNRWELARVLRSAGELYRRLNDQAAALACYEEAVPLYREHGDPFLLAHTIRHLGDVYRHAGKSDAAAPCYLEALELYRRYPDPPPGDLANALRSLAVLREDAGAIEEAKQLWTESHRLYQTADVPAGVAGSSAHLALLAWREGDRETARQWLAEAQAASEVAGDSGVAGYVAELRVLISS